MAYESRGKHIVGTVPPERGMGMRTPLLCVTLLCAWGLAASAASETFPLKPTELSEPRLVHPNLTWEAYPPADAGAMPAFKAKWVWFTEMKLGHGKPVLVAVDSEATAPAKKAAGGSAPEILYRVYVDRKGRRTLAGEQPFVTAKEKIKVYSRMQDMLLTGPVTLPVTYNLPGGGKLKGEATFRFAFYPGRPVVATVSPFVVLAVTRQWKGRIALGDREVDFAVADGNGDATISLDEPVSRDRMWLSSNGKSLYPGSDQLSLTRYVESEGRYYELQVRPDGGAVTVSPYEGELGKVAITSEDPRGAPLPLEGVCLLGTNALVELAPPRLWASVPPGTYFEAEFLVARPGKTEPTWYFEVDDPGLVVKPGKTLWVRAGGELKLAIDITPSTGDEKTLHVSINLQTVGSGLRFSTLRMASLAPGKVDVYDAGGKLVASEQASPG